MDPGRILTDPAKMGRQGDTRSTQVCMVKHEDNARKRPAGGPQARWILARPILSYINLIRDKWHDRAKPWHQAAKAQGSQAKGVVDNTLLEFYGPLLWKVEGGEEAAFVAGVERWPEGKLLFWWMVGKRLVGVVQWLRPRRVLKSEHFRVPTSLKKRRSAVTTTTAQWWS